VGRLRSRFSVEVRPGVCILLAAVLLTFPVRWVIAWFGAVVFHELCHYTALRLLRVPVNGISVTSGGVLMHTGAMDRKRGCLCALAGPLGALLLLGTLRVFPALAVCALFQSFYNLLPVGTLDGGLALGWMFPGKTGRGVRKLLEGTAIFAAFAAAVYGAVSLDLGLLPLFGALGLLLRSDAVKIPCKDGRLGVQ